MFRLKGAVTDSLKIKNRIGLLWNVVSLRKSQSKEPHWLFYGLFLAFKNFSKHLRQQWFPYFLSMDIIQHYKNSKFIIYYINYNECILLFYYKNFTEYVERDVF